MRRQETNAFEIRGRPCPPHSSGPTAPWRATTPGPIIACSRPVPRLTQEEFEAPRTGFFPSLKATLNHILIIDWFYVDGLEGGWLGPKAWADRTPCATVADLQREQAAVDRRLHRRLRGADRGLAQRHRALNRDTRVQTERRDRLLLHLFQHQIHHRGQAHAMLSRHAREAAAARRVLSPWPRLRCGPREFAALGWTEETVWGREGGG